jgi:type IV secretion system protein VirB1
LQAANANASGRDQAIANVVASFATKAPATPPEAHTRPTVYRSADISIGDTPPINTPAPSDRERPNWDVYRSGLGTSAFVYER